MEDILKINGRFGRSSTTIMPELLAGGASCSDSEVGSSLSVIGDLWLTEEEEMALLQ